MMGIHSAMRRLAPLKSSGTGMPIERIPVLGMSESFKGGSV
jgi:hypothetical protein